jgi:hypothetical protein
LGTRNNYAQGPWCLEAIKPVYLRVLGRWGF